jgi:hypothetical protein
MLWRLGHSKVRPMKLFELITEAIRKRTPEGTIPVVTSQTVEYPDSVKVENIEPITIEELFANNIGAVFTVERAKELAKSVTIWDQTIGCDLCGEAWWSENCTDDPTLFHAPTCPLFGNREAAAHYCSLAHIEERLGHKAGCENTLEGWRDLAKRYAVKANMVPEFPPTKA